MSQERDRRNSGILFKNDRKTKPTHPDYTGTFTDSDGVERFVDLWKKEGQKGTFLTFSIGKEKNTQGGGRQNSQRRESQQDSPF